MKKKFQIIVLLSEFSRLISRILIILNRKNINILYLNVSSIKNPIEFCCKLEVESYEECMKKIIKQIEKQIGIISAIYQEIK